MRYYSTIYRQLLNIIPARELRYFFVVTKLRFDSREKFEMSKCEPIDLAILFIIESKPSRFYNISVIKLAI